MGTDTGRDSNSDVSITMLVDLGGLSWSWVEIGRLSVYQFAVICGDALVTGGRSVELRGRWVAERSLPPHPNPLPLGEGTSAGLTTLLIFCDNAGVLFNFKQNWAWRKS